MAWIFAVERILLALIVGGGIIMASCIRPLFLKVLAEEAGSSTAVLVENVSISAWNKYNRIALVSTFLIAIIEISLLLLNKSFSYIHLSAVAFMMLALLRKLQVDQKLKKRVEKSMALAVGSKEQQAGHKEVELLSIGILILAFIMII